MFRAQVCESVYLQLLEERHAAEVFALVDQDRAHLREWLPWVDATETSDDTLSFIRSSREQFASNKGFVAGIWSEQRFCGVIGTHKLDLLNRKGEIGYWLGQSFQRRGIMTAACRTVVTHLLTEIDLNRVTIQCARENKKSCAVAERLGFTEEGLAREAQFLRGHFHDLRRFSMLKRDWKPEPGSGMILE
jgi:ribosomal-protein-serine acetyltransferase